MRTVLKPTATIPPAISPRSRTAKANKPPFSTIPQPPHQTIYPDATNDVHLRRRQRLIHVAGHGAWGGAIDFRYDSLDRLIQEITGQGAVAYQYDVLESTDTSDGEWIGAGDLSV